ncbi:MAG: B12-binding domain-containing radical SAM protein, partial [bacterium]|nr:B12-binding domain-containing radical SAM protein [bacterium]
MKKKVILIDPSNKGYKNLRPQLGTLYLAAMVLEMGIDVELLDFTRVPDAGERLERYLQDDNLLCVGISAVLGPILAGGLKVAREVRKHRPDIPIVWGGPHPSTAPRETLEHELVDAICIGEGEIAFPEMLEAYIAGRSLENIKGTGYKENGKPVLNPPRDQYFNMDDLPPLPYHLVDLGLFRTPNSVFFGLKQGRMLSIETSRSCSYRCRYCVNSVKREKFRGMSSQRVLSYMEEIVKLGITSITINDDNFFVNHERSVQILEAIARKNWNLEIYAPARSD